MLTRPIPIVSRLINIIMTIEERVSDVDECNDEIVDGSGMEATQAGGGT